MNLLKKWWIWFWPAMYITFYLLSWISSPKSPDFPYHISAMWLMILSIPLFILLSLIFTIKENFQKKKKIFSGWKIWFWLILSLILFYIVIFINPMISWQAWLFFVIIPIAVIAIFVLFFFQNI